MKYLFTWLSLTIVVLSVSGGLILPTPYHLVKRGVAATATVSDLFPDLHNSVQYDYTVNGHAFQVSNAPWPPNPEIGKLKAGQQVVIYYDRQRPSVTALGAPYPMLKKALWDVIWATLIIPPILMWIITSKTRPRSW